MTLEVIAVGGPPAVGKSSLMEEVLDATSDVRFNGNKFKWGELVGSFYTDDELLVFGRYDGSKDFEGTDVLSMSANNHAKQFTKMAVNLERFNTAIFEGDRLFNDPYLEMCREHPEIELTAIVLQASTEELDRRHDARDDDHDDQWKTGMRSQYENYASEPWTTTMENETEEDMQENIQKIRQLAGLASGDAQLQEEQQDTFADFGGDA